MKCNILTFGIARDIVKTSQLELNLEGEQTIRNLKEKLVNQFPEFEKLRHYSIAVNAEYRLDDFILNEGDEIAIIPPVSGG